jgi:hypothetical protein
MSTLMPRVLVLTRHDTPSQGLDKCQGSIMIEVVGNRLRNDERTQGG